MRDGEDAAFPGDNEEAAAAALAPGPAIRSAISWSCDSRGRAPEGEHSSIPNGADPGTSSTTSTLSRDGARARTTGEVVSAAPLAEALMPLVVSFELLLPLVVVVVVVVVVAAAAAIVVAVAFVLVTEGSITDADACSVATGEADFAATTAGASLESVVL